MRGLSVVLLICGLCMPLTARAGNSDEVNAGIDVTLSGGAVVATVYTGAALWYNPAGIARIDETSLELTGATLQVQMIDALSRGTWPPISRPCGAEFEQRFDGGCWEPAPGDPALRVTMEGEDDVLVLFTSVRAEDIVDILIIHPEEDEVALGDLVFVEVVGLTADGTQVHGIHATFFRLGLGAFAYQFVPELEPQTIPVEALGIEKNLVYRGEPRPHAATRLGETD